MSRKIRSGDDVVVLAGKDKNKVGKVVKIIINGIKKKAIVSGVNICKKHAKPKAGVGGGILNKELSIDISNIALLDPKYKSPTKIGFKIIKGKRVRFAKASGEIID